MKQSEHEVKSTIQGLGQQLEGQVPPALYQVARLVSNAAAAPAPRRSWLRKGMEIAAACILLGSIVGMAAYRNLHPAGEVKLNPDACGYRDAILDNLRLAARTLPLPSAKISMQAESKEDAAKQAALYAEGWRDHVQKQKEQGMLAFQVIGEEARLSIWSGESKKDPGRGFTGFHFARGGLNEASDLPEVLEQLSAAGGSGQVRMIGARTMIPKISKEEYYRGLALDRYSWTLKDVLRWYEANVMGAPCVTKTVPIYENGPIQEIQLPLLQLIPNRYVGFHGDAVVTFAEGEGMFGGGSETIWYPMTGLVATSSTTGTVIPPSRRNPAERARLQAEFDRLKAEVEREEAKLAAMKVPNLEEVGEATYTKAAEENAQQGAKVKDLHLQLARAYQALIDPLTDEVKLEKEIERARVALTMAEQEWRKNAEHPEAAKLLALKQKQLAQLDEIERAFTSGAKTPQALLQELDAVLNPARD